MEYIHGDLGFLNGGDIVQVDLDTQANVLLLDNSNYYKYQSGRDFSYYGGLATRTPVNIQVPYSGCWNLVIDLANVGGAGSVRYSIKVIPIEVEEEEEEEEELDGYLFDRERQHIEMEIRDKEALLDEFKRMHPRDWINIRRMEKEIDGLRKYLKGWR